MSFGVVHRNGGLCWADWYASHGFLWLKRTGVFEVDVVCGCGRRAALWETTSSDGSCGNCSALDPPTKNQVLWLLACAPAFHLIILEWPLPVATACSGPPFRIDPVWSNYPKGSTPRYQQLILLHPIRKVLGTMAPHEHRERTPVDASDWKRSQARELNSKVRGAGVS